MLVSFYLGPAFWGRCSHVLNPLILSFILLTLQKCQLLQTTLFCHAGTRLWEFIFSLNEDHSDIASACLLLPFPCCQLSTCAPDQTCTEMERQVVSSYFHFMIVTSIRC